MTDPRTPEPIDPDDPYDHDLPPYQRHSAASRDAARKAAPSIGPKARQVLQALRARGAEGATDAELQAMLKMDGNTERPRRRELQKRRVIRGTGTFRPTNPLKPRGPVSEVWVAVEFGQGDHAPLPSPAPLAPRPTTPDQRTLFDA